MGRTATRHRCLLTVISGPGNLGDRILGNRSARARRSKCAVVFLARLSRCSLFPGSPTRAPTETRRRCDAGFCNRDLDECPARSDSASTQPFTVLSDSGRSAAPANTRSEVGFDALGASLRRTRPRLPPPQDRQTEASGPQFGLAAHPAIADGALCGAVRQQQVVEMCMMTMGQR